MIAARNTVIGKLELGSVTIPRRTFRAYSYVALEHDDCFHDRYPSSIVSLLAESVRHNMNSTKATIIANLPKLVRVLAIELSYVIGLLRRVPLIRVSCFRLRQLQAGSSN